MVAATAAMSKAAAKPKLTKRGPRVASGPGPAGGTVSDIPIDSVGVNADIWVKHRENVQKVLADPFFSNITALQPLGIKAGEAAGHVAKFEAATAANSLSGAGKHTCAVNVFWLDFSYSPIGQLPMSWPSIEDLIKFNFTEGGAGFSDPALEIPFLRSEVDAKDFGSKGKWRHTSPTEYILAFVAATAAAINAGADLTMYRKWALTAEAHLQVVETHADIEWRSRQVRENLKQGSTMATTPVQRIFDVNAKRTEQGQNLGRDAIVQAYKKLRLSTASEEISPNWVDCAFTIWDRALCKPAIQKVVLSEEAFKGDSIFNSIMKMQHIISKGKRQKPLSGRSKCSTTSISSATSRPTTAPPGA